MRKYIPYIIVVVAVVLLAALLLSSANKPRRIFDDRITLRHQDKIPYGTYAAWQLLPSVFPNAEIHYEKQRPGYWEYLYNDQSNQAAILIGKDFDADQDELNKILEFASNGNYVFIIARFLSYDASKFFMCSDNGNFFNEDEDSLHIKLEHPPFTAPSSFVYPGKKYESFFSDVTDERTIILGRSKNHSPNFIQLKAGRGSIFIHLAPLAFSNYFILHKNNIEYYKNALAVIPQSVSRIVWDDYYLTKLKKKEEEPGIFRVLFQYPAFKWGLLTAFFTLLIFALLEVRRKQRAIPAWEKPKNDSLDFVKTIGRLYYDKSDHKNLAKKMAAYFLEHIRTQYKLATHTVDDAFAGAVQAKTGYSASGIKGIIDFINYVESVPAISETELAAFHKQLELFYQNT